MKTFFSVAGKVVKVSLAVLAMGLLCQLALSVYYGYYKINLTYGGAYYYYWRVTHVDKELSRSTFAEIKTNQQKKSNFLNDYLSYVQVTKTPKLKGYFPLLQAYGTIDTFVLGPKYTWRIFEVPGDTKATKKRLDLEIKFLKFRARFLNHIYNITYDEKHPFFSKKGKDGKNSHEPVVKDSFIKAIDKKTIDEFFATSGNDLSQGFYEKLTEMVDKIKNKTPNYRVGLTKNKATMTNEFKSDMMELLSLYCPELNITSSYMEDKFFPAMAGINLNAYQNHHLNRIILSILYCNLDQDFTAKDGKYQKLKADHASLSGQQKKNAAEKKKQLARLISDMKTRRMELILNWITGLFSSILGDKGPIISKNADKRNWIERRGSLKTMKKRVHSDF